MKIYLAGKVEKNDWRHTAVRGIDEVCFDLYYNPCQEWPILPRAIADKYDYCGPYFISCDHGCSHEKNSHGYGKGCGANFDIELYDHVNGTEASRVHVTIECKKAIKASDVVFAWIDDLTAYGTLFELGYATALGKKIYLYLKKEIPENPNDWISILECERTYQFDDLWFTIYSIRSNGHLDYADNPLNAFNDFLNHIEENIRQAKIESPMELMFYNAIKGKIRDIEPQWEVVSDGRLYRVDFAIPSRKIAFEIDGHEYHKTRAQRTHDARRERDLQKEGWRVIRFTGSEIYNDLSRCISDACRLVQGGNV